MKFLFYFIIFPGFLFTAVVGLLASWVDRKVTARVQWRVGPPWYQNFADFVKLLLKETIVPEGANRITFLGAPLIAAASVVLVSVILWLTNLWPEKSFFGDMIVVIYLLTIPAIATIMAGFASRNPLASIGASREMKLVLSYELPFILAIFVPVIKAGGIIKLGQILTYQAQNTIMLAHPSCIIAFIIALLCMQAKLGLVPFDVAEAETEIIYGVFTEYSGAPLAVIKLTRQMMLFVVPMFLIVMFAGGIKTQGISLLWGILKYVGVVAFATVVRNTNPRVRIDQALKFFWGPCTILAIVAVILAFLGL